MHDNKQFVAITKLQDKEALIFKALIDSDISND